MTFAVQTNIHNEQKKINKNFGMSGFIEKNTAACWRTSLRLRPVG
jgi:hypothetical protein